MYLNDVLRQAWNEVCPRIQIVVQFPYPMVVDNYSRTMERQSILDKLGELRPSLALNHGGAEVDELIEAIRARAETENKS